MDLAKSVTLSDTIFWDEGSWQYDSSVHTVTPAKFNVVAMDFGCKQSILRRLKDSGCAVTVVPADTSADAVLALQPDGLFLSNGPGDPAATAKYAGAEIAKLISTNLPVFGICIGHQLMA